MSACSAHEDLPLSVFSPGSVVEFCFMEGDKFRNIYLAIYGDQILLFSRLKIVLSFISRIFKVFTSQELMYVYTFHP